MGQRISKAEAMSSTAGPRTPIVLMEAPAFRDAIVKRSIKDVIADKIAGLIASGMAVHSPVTVRAATVRRSIFGLAEAVSIGLKAELEGERQSQHVGWDAHQLGQAPVEGLAEEPAIHAVDRVDQHTVAAFEVRTSSPISTISPATSMPRIIGNGTVMLGMPLRVKTS